MFGPGEFLNMTVIIIVPKNHFKTADDLKVDL